MHLGIFTQERNMALGPKRTIGKATTTPAQRQFTDRELPQQSFVKAFETLDQKEYNVLTYYGVGGIGKSSLQRHLKDKHLKTRDNAVFSSVDFEIEANRTPHKALRVLAKSFKTDFKIPFSTFDIAYFIYWSKAFPDYDFKKEGLPFVEEGSILAGVVGLFESSGGMVGTALSVVDYAAKKLKSVNFDSDVQSELKQLNNLEVHEVEERLSMFFAHDINTHKSKKRQKSFVIFLDTYEALWKANRSDANRLSQDAWIREMVAHLPQVLFVICGREKIRWIEADSDWEEVLDQHILGSLSPEDAKDFLKSCEITDELIQDAIIQNSEGLPYYLDLSVDTYFLIQNSGKHPTSEDFSEVGKADIEERFMRYLTDSEKDILYVLANARFYTKELFELLLGRHYQTSVMYRINHFSFISDENGVYTIHDLMKSSLLAYQNDELKEDVNTKLFDHYDSKLQNLDIKHISEESIEALPEAFYHKEQLHDADALFEWYIQCFSTFMYGAQYQAILNPSIRLVELLEAALGTEHPSTARSYNDLGYYYVSQGRYDLAKPLLEKALAVRKALLGTDAPETAVVYNNLAYMYRCEERYDEAVPVCETSVAIREKVLGTEHPYTANSYNNLACILKLQNAYAKAEPLFKKALLIRTKVLGEEHPETLASCNDLGDMYTKEGRFDEAEPLLNKALRLRQNVLSDEHPDTVTSYINLGALYVGLHDYASAQPLYEKALAIRERSLGVDHPETIQSRKNLEALLAKLM